jgi:ABC-2 type transport system permease protein
VGRAIFAVGEGRWLEGSLLTVLSLSLAGVIFWVALTSAEKLYYTGWSSMQGQGQKKKVQKATPSAAVKGPGLARLLPAQVRGLVVKDFLVIRRDLRNLSAFITPLVLGIVLMFSMARGGAGGFEGDSTAFAAFGQNARFYLGISVLVFVSYSTLLNLAIGAFSREGRNYWLVKTAPVSANSLLIAKFLVTYIPSILVNWFLVGIMALVLPSTPVMIVYSLVVMVLAIAGMSGLQLAFGVAGAKLDWQDPRHMNNATTGCLGSLVGMAFMVFILAIFFGPPILFNVLGLGETLGQWIGLAAGGILCVLGAVLPLVLVRKRVDRIGIG